MSKRVIMVGFHFPPSTLSSGHLRLLAFTRYLPEFGWEPVVLSATRCAYERSDPTSIRRIPEGCHVHRALALDAKRHLGLFGRYPSALAQPDRWASWWPAAVWTGLRLIRRYRVQAIWSTYPIMTAHCIAHTLNRLTGIPWIADFRDPVASSLGGRAPITARSLVRWEGRVAERAACSVFTTPSARRWCLERNPGLCVDGRSMVIGNGYDDAAFIGLPATTVRPVDRPVVLVHSGLLYPDGRNPKPFLSALARLQASGAIHRDKLRVILRASGCESAYQRDIERLGLQDVVTLAPSIPNEAALEEQAGADALLLVQGAKYDCQIPAKVYEYLRVGRPILALVSGGGDTAALLRETGGAVLVSPDDADAIARELPLFLDLLQQGRAPHARPEVVARFSRREGAASLAALMNRVSA